MIGEEVDGTLRVEKIKLDVYAIDDYSLFLLGRPWLTILIGDKYIIPLSYHLSFEPPSYRTTLAALKNIFMSKTCVNESSPDKDNQWLSFNLPSKLVVDSGEFESNHLVDVCSQLGIAIETAVPFRSAKAIVDRDIQKLFDYLSREVEENSLIKLSKIHEVIHGWLKEIYADKLISQEDDSKEKSNGTNSGLPSPNLLDVIFGYPGRSRVTKEGIKFARLKYQSKELQEIFEQAQKYSDITYLDVDFKYNPEDVSKIFVYDCVIKHDYIEVPCLDKLESNKLFSQKLITKYKGKTRIEELLNKLKDESKRLEVRDFSFDALSPFPLIVERKENKD
jgi:putative transposase